MKVQVSRRWLIYLAAAGPGLIAAAAGNDAGGIVTYSSAGAQFVYRTLFLMVLITIAYVIVQEMVARLATYTGKGLAALIREEFDLRLTAFAITAFAIANVGLMVTEFGGIATSFELFNVSRYISVPIAAVAIWSLVLFGSYRYAERIFLLLTVVFIAYPIAAVLAHPNWHQVAVNTVWPHFEASKSFLLLSVALIGTTITPYIQLYEAGAVVDKGVKPENYHFQRVDAITGAVLAALVAMSIIVATGATIGGTGPLTSATTPPRGSSRSPAPSPRRCSASGLLGASALAAAVVPLSTSYAVAEAIGVERSVSSSFRQAPVFLGIFTFQILIGAAVVLVPGNLITLILNTQVLEGVITPMTLILILVLANRRSLLGSAANGPVARWVGGLAIVSVAVVAGVYVVLTVLGLVRPGLSGASARASPRRRLRRTRGFGEARGPWCVVSGYPLPKTPRQKWIETKESWERSRHIELPAPIPAAPPRPGGLRVAFLIYRGNPRCGGQGVYTRHLTRELVALGHSVEVFAGPPWPDLDEGVGFTPVRGLDLYRQPDPFRVPAWSEFTSREDWTEFAIMCTAGFGEPLAYSLRARQLLAQRRDEFDVVHDNQCLGNGMLGMVEDGWPLLTTLHHPITVDRELALSHTTNPWQRFTTQRWFGFLGMQVRVARALPAVLTVSQNSRQDIAAQMDVPPERMTVVPVGVDHTVFRPFEDVSPVPGRIMVTSSSDVPMKGLVPLLEAVAKLRTERDVELTVIGRPNEGGRVEKAIARLGLADAVHCVSGITDDELARLYGEAEVAVVPSLYEGFSLPAIEAMACGVALVATTGGALPEVVGTDGETGLLVAPDDPGALAGVRSPVCSTTRSCGLASARRDASES